jgi:hypothetical protein
MCIPHTLEMVVPINYEGLGEDKVYLVCMISERYL